MAPGLLYPSWRQLSSLSNVSRQMLARAEEDAAPIANEDAQPVVVTSPTSSPDPLEVTSKAVSSSDAASQPTPSSEAPIISIEISSEPAVVSTSEPVESLVAVPSRSDDDVTPTFTSTVDPSSSSVAPSTTIDTEVVPAPSSSSLNETSSVPENTTSEVSQSSAGASMTSPAASESPASSSPARTKQRRPGPNRLPPESSLLPEASSSPLDQVEPSSLALSDELGTTLEVEPTLAAVTETAIQVSEEPSTSSADSEVTPRSRRPRPSRPVFRPTGSPSDVASAPDASSIPESVSSATTPDPSSQPEPTSTVQSNTQEQGASVEPTVAAPTETGTGAPDDVGKPQRGGPKKFKKVVRPSQSVTGSVSVTESEVPSVTPVPDLEQPEPSPEPSLSATETVSEESGDEGPTVITGPPRTRPSRRPKFKKVSPPAKPSASTPEPEVPSVTLVPDVGQPKPSPVEDDGDDSEEPTVPAGPPRTRPSRRPKFKKVSPPKNPSASAPGPEIPSITPVPDVEQPKPSPVEEDEDEDDEGPTVIAGPPRGRPSRRPKFKKVSPPKQPSASTPAPEVPSPDVEQPKSSPVEEEEDEDDEGPTVTAGPPRGRPSRRPKFRKVNHPDKATATLGPEAPAVTPTPEVEQPPVTEDSEDDDGDDEPTAPVGGAPPTRPSGRPKKFKKVKNLPPKPPLILGPIFSILPIPDLGLPTLTVGTPTETETLGQQEPVNSPPASDPTPAASPPRGGPRPRPQRPRPIISIDLPDVLDPIISFLPLPSEPPVVLEPPAQVTGTVTDAAPPVASAPITTSTRARRPPGGNPLTRVLPGIINTILEPITGGATLTASSPPSQATGTVTGVIPPASTAPTVTTARARVNPITRIVGGILSPILNPGGGQAPTGTALTTVGSATPSSANIPVSPSSPPGPPAGSPRPAPSNSRGESPVPNITNTLIPIDIPRVTGTTTPARPGDPISSNGPQSTVGGSQVTRVGGGSITSIQDLPLPVPTAVAQTTGELDDEDVIEVPTTIVEPLVSTGLVTTTFAGRVTVIETTSTLGLSTRTTVTTIPKPTGTELVAAAANGATGQQAMIGGVIGAVIFLIVALGLGFFMRRRRRLRIANAETRLFGEAGSGSVPPISLASPTVATKGHLPSPPELRDSTGSYDQSRHRSQHSSDILASQYSSQNSSRTPTGFESENPFSDEHATLSSLESSQWSSQRTTIGGAALFAENIKTKLLVPVVQDPFADPIGSNNSGVGETNPFDDHTIPTKYVTAHIEPENFGRYSSSTQGTGSDSDGMSVNSDAKRASAASSVSAATVIAI